MLSAAARAPSRRCVEEGTPSRTRPSSTNCATKSPALRRSRTRLTLGVIFELELGNSGHAFGVARRRRAVVPGRAGGGDAARRIGDARGPVFHLAAISGRA